MAVCPKCGSGVNLTDPTCASCGVELQIVEEPPVENLEALKEDIEDYVEETSPGDLPEAERQIDAWKPTVGTGAPEIVSSREDATPVVVYDAVDETTAHLVVSLLNSEGIDAMINRQTIPSLETTYRMDEGSWGQVMVHQVDRERALDIVLSYESHPGELTEVLDPADPA